MTIKLRHISNFLRIVKLHQDKNKSLENGEKISKQVLQSKKRCLDIMAKYFYINTCRRRFILESFSDLG